MVRLVSVAVPADGNQAVLNASAGLVGNEDNDFDYETHRNRHQVLEEVVSVNLSSSS